MKQQILKYIEYNLWANQILIDYLNNVPNAHIEQEIISSFPSIRKTLLHIWDAETLWQLRLEGISLAEFPSLHFHGNNQLLFKNLIKTSKDFHEKVEDQPKDFFTKTLTFKTISYGESSQLTYDMIHHCMNHSTYHRGQVITMLRQLGYTDLPHLDFMLYLIKLGATN